MMDDLMSQNELNIQFYLWKKSAVMAWSWHLCQVEFAMIHTDAAFGT